VPLPEKPTPAPVAAPAEPPAQEPPPAHAGATGSPAVASGTPATSAGAEGTPAPVGPNAGPDAAAAAGPVGAQTPIVYVEKIGPASINKSKTLSYTIVVRNPGPVAVADVRVEDETPAGARILRADPAPDDHGRMLSWRLGALPPGAERRMQVDCQLTTEGEMLSRATVTFSVASVLKTRVTQPCLSITKTGPETVQIGDPAAFQITVSNSGTGPATNVVLHDKLPPGLKHPQGRDIEADLGTIEAGQTRTLTLSATAVSPGRQVNEAVATADDGLRAAAQATVLVTEPLLVLRATGPQRRYLNRTAEFDLEVGNPGTAAATNVRVADVLPPGLEFEAASDNGAYDPASRTVTWNLATLPPRQTQHLSVRTTAKAVGDLVNHAEAVADRGLAAKADVGVHVEGIAALLLEVVDLDDPVEVGGETSYEIRVVNQGTAPSTGLQIVATVPAEMAVRGATGPTPYRIQGQQVVFEPMSRLAAHADTVYRVKVLAQKPGDLRFKVQLTSEQLRAPVIEEESTRAYSD
jgi:uncharacterized repeat protein (TIGR01451 family)